MVDSKTDEKNEKPPFEEIQVVRQKVKKKTKPSTPQDIESFQSILLLVFF